MMISVCNTRIDVGTNDALLGKMQHGYHILLLDEVYVAIIGGHSVLRTMAKIVAHYFNVSSKLHRN